MQHYQAYIEAHRGRFLDELMAFLRIPSVSTDPAHKADVRRAAGFLRDRLLAAGADQAMLVETEGHPIVYAEKIIDPQAPTVLVYGHYDVQPADPYELWQSPPFEPTIRQTPVHPDGAVFARGACDDKGQVYLQVKAFEAMVQTNSLPCNVRFMIEGEEESGSASLPNFLHNYADRLRADVILISDTSIISNDTPSIECGLRGLAYVEVCLTGPNRDLHSGVYGGAVANPINVLCSMIASLKDEQGRITIPGFYDKVREVSQEERALMAQIPFDEESYKRDLGVAALFGEIGYSTIERTSIRPTLDVNGIWGGYTGEGAKTVLPSKAYAKISMRLVPDQDPEEIMALFADHFKAIAPPYVSVEVKPHHGGRPVVTPIDSPGFQAASLAFEQAWGKKPIPTRGGGSIPIVALFEEVLGLKSVLMGFGLDSDAIHSPNEHFGLFNFYKGIETVPLFYHHFRRLHAAPAAP